MGPTSLTNLCTSSNMRFCCLNHNVFSLLWGGQNIQENTQNRLAQLRAATCSSISCVFPSKGLKADSKVKGHTNTDATRRLWRTPLPKAELAGLTATVRWCQRGKALLCSLVGPPVANEALEMKKPLEDDMAHAALLPAAQRASFARGSQALAD